MAQLEIDNASIGYNKNNVDAALEKIHVEVIDTAIARMGDAWSELQEQLREFVIGQAGTNFNMNMYKARQTVEKGLEDCYDALKGELYEIVNAMAKLDQELVTRR